MAEGRQGNLSYYLIHCVEQLCALFVASIHKNEFLILYQVYLW